MKRLVNLLYHGGPITKALPVVHSTGYVFDRVTKMLPAEALRELAAAVTLLPPRKHVNGADLWAKVPGIGAGSSEVFLLTVSPEAFTDAIARRNDPKRDRKKALRGNDHPWPPDEVLRDMALRRVLLSDANVTPIEEETAVPVSSPYRAPKAQEIARTFAEFVESGDDGSAQPAPADEPLSGGDKE